MTTRAPNTIFVDARSFFTCAAYKLLMNIGENFGNRHILPAINWEQKYSM